MDADSRGKMAVESPPPADDAMMASRYADATSHAGLNQEDSNRRAEGNAHPLLAPWGGVGLSAQRDGLLHPPPQGCHMGQSWNSSSDADWYRAGLTCVPDGHGPVQDLHVEGEEGEATARGDQDGKAEADRRRAVMESCRVLLWSGAGSGADVIVDGQRFSGNAWGARRGRDRSVLSMPWRVGS